MAPLSSSKRTFNPRTPRPQPKILRATQSADQAPNSEPPPKKRRYVPGGPGGGGRYVDVDGAETTTGSIGEMTSLNHTAPRVRPVREPSSNNVVRRTQPSTPPVSTRPRREKNQTRRYSSAAAAALAVAQGDGYKPREERGWEEFHPDLDIDVKVAVFSSDEVDGIKPSSTLPNGNSSRGTDESGDSAIEGLINGSTPVKRRPGRPRLSETFTNEIGTPRGPKIVPPPGPNPRERLTLPKPSFVLKDPFLPFEQKGVGQQNYVDRTMASVGYQESDIFLRHERRLIRMAEGAAEEDLDLSPSTPIDGDVNAAIGNIGVGRVEYDMDEQDAKWLETYNAQRREEQFEPIKPAVFEITMTKIEKEWHALEKRIPKPNPKPPQTQRPRSSSAAAVNGEHAGPGEEQDSKCAICDDGDCENANAIVFCDGCDLAVHQECYGVPYIPEGQWLCRKCQLIGRASPSCIFCPNTEGAFKQTNTSKWSHLLCAVWIPEVSIGNPSLMEPVNEVEKVPRNRWKLTCYICRQKMGACIQCSNKNCFVAFHVTCARRARLYLKMKLIPGAPAVMESNGLKAFCDKHVPPDWRREHNTDAATAEALEYYRNTMQGRRWGDSQAAALALGPDSQDGIDHAEDDNRAITPRITLTVGGNKRKRTAAPKTIWKLPSGAPVIPQVVLNSVIASLQRFTVRQRKQYAEDACKYWTLKRESRRGAALLKRLQLQLETFSSMEMTRRNFAGMGVAGAVRLQRRIGFADKLYLDLDRVRMLCDEVKKREREKLKDAETLRSIVDLVYFPIPPMLWPILEKAFALDGKAVFRLGLLSIRSKLEQRAYTSVSSFSRDLANVFTSEIGVESVGDTAELQMQISGRAPELSLEQREKRKLAKRIIKAIQPALEDSLRKESELNGKPFEKELKDLDVLLENSVLSRRGSLVAMNGPEAVERYPLVNGIKTDVEGDHMEAPETSIETLHAEPEEQAANEDKDVTMVDVNGGTDTGHGTKESSISETNGVVTAKTFLASQPMEGRTKNQAATSSSRDIQMASATSLTSPVDSLASKDQPPLSQGGIQWYMQPFDPIGTTIHEERWTGRDVLRGMSEELSEIGEDELRNLVGDEPPEYVPDLPNGGPGTSSGDGGPPADAAVAGALKLKTHKTRRRWKGFR
ncbi:NuA3 HAT complex component NTO1 [[Emmonsia] crescens]|uniref:NuA3 HAT complex component NTO1 n=1 Tax=[Emmonsia] crescens TaxID=73230 RepID=A0A2B7Z7Y2_9EURO|nr:NuA3 HAT complex component NTO1 [Emmonsia crescens]